MKSSIGSDAFVLLSLAFIAVLVLVLLRHFLPLRKTPAYLIVPIFLALALPVSIFLILPVDLASSARTKDEASKGIWLPHGVLLVAWRLVYWLTFALTWYVVCHSNDECILSYLGSFSLCLVNTSILDTEPLKIEFSTLCSQTGVIT